MTLAVFLAAPSGGEVLKHIADRNLVGVSVGSEDGIKEGDRVTIWRGPERIAVCEVVKTGRTVSFLRIVSRTPGTSPEVGDKVIVGLKPGAKEAEKPPEKGPSPPDKPAQGKPEAKGEESAKEERGASAEQESKVEGIPAPEDKAPPLAARPEELLAVGAAADEILVSSSHGVHILSRGGVTKDEAVLPHEILRFITWGDRLWAETDGGVLLREKGAWREFPWSANLNVTEPSFARIAVSGESAWGIFGRNLLRWNVKAQTLTLRGGEKILAQGAWERRDLFPVELQAVLALGEDRLLLAGGDSRLYEKKGPIVEVLAALSLAEGDPLLLELAVDFEGSTWGLFFADGGGLFRIDKEKKEVKVITRRGSEGGEEALPAGRLLRLLADSQGRICVLHQKDGVFNHQLGKWKHIGPKRGAVEEKAIDMTTQGDAVLLLTERRLLRLGASEEELFAFAKITMEPVDREPQEGGDSPVESPRKAEE